MRHSSTITEADILAEVVAPSRAEWQPEAARSILSLRLSDEATKQIRRLLEKNNRGTISAEEKGALEKYLRVGQFLDLLHAKAKLSLEQAATPH
jgi:hypothetical protein